MNTPLVPPSHFGEGATGQIHRQFTSAQVRFLLQAYLSGNMGRTDVQGSQEIGKTGFFAFLKDYWKDPEGFGVSHARRSLARSR